MAGALRNFGRWSGNGRGRLYLNVGHTGLNAAGFRQWIRDIDVRPIYLVHDLIPIAHPEFCRAGETEKHRERMRTILTTATGLIGNSQVTLDELAEFARRERLPSPPATAAWLGTDRIQTPKGTSSRGCSEFVTIGTIEGRKNHLLLLEIWSKLIDRFGAATPRLTIIGQRGWEAQRVFDLLDRSDKLRNHVIELSGCSDQELARHLASACALLFPSRAEGYGLPLMEAFGLGVPVIASDLPVFRELAGDVPFYLDPIDATSWEKAILDFARPDSLARSKQIQNIKSVPLPDWNGHFAIVERWLGLLSGTAQPDQNGFDQRLHG
jgi:glycosyltransferase involved in cell wall biosynthesis